MAITRLKDIVTVFQDKWTYGDSRFGYESEINETHNTVYPAMIIQPPESIMPDIYSGREEFEFEVNFYNLYQQAAQSAVTLQHRWDNLQDLATEWMDLVLKNFQDATVQVYLNDESIEFERVKEVANDRLVQIKLLFTMSAFTKCFRPVSNYPSDFSDLVVWLRADSGVTFDIATKRVSLWSDYSGNSNNVAQSTTASQPLRIGYDGANDKARFTFDGTNDYLESSSNCPITGNNLSIFYVAKANQTTTLSQRIIGYKDSSDDDRLNLSIDSTGRIVFKAIDDDGEVGSITSAGSDLGTTHHIVSARIHNHMFRLQYNNNTEVHQNFAHFNNSDGFAEAPFRVGHILDGAADTYLNGEVQEIIIYNRYVSNEERNEIRDYLNNKYRIY